MGRKVLLFALTSFTVMFLGACSYAFNFFMSTTSSIHEEVERNPKFEGRLENIDLEDGDPISVLIEGVDTREGEEGGRADSLTLLTINPQTKSTHMVSIPRDLYMEIEGAVNKINSTYQVGGTENTLASVENLLDVPVDYFVRVNMQSFKDIVDSLGGVEVNNKMEFSTNDLKFAAKKYTHFPKGQIKLNGREALIYARMRKIDPRGDFGRQERQRQVIEAVIDKGASISSFAKFGDMVKIIEDNVRTNMSFKDMWQVQSNYKSARENIKQHKIKGSGKTIDGTYYYMPDKEEVRKISNRLKQNLELQNKSEDQKE